MIKIIAIYCSSDTVFETIIKNGYPIRTGKVILNFKDVCSEDGELLAVNCTVNNAKSYENLICNKRYVITCSDFVDGKISRPSNCELLQEKDEDNSAIQDVVNQYKAELINEAELNQKLIKFSHEAYTNYIISIIKRSLKKNI
jgi:hypothetical protein